MAVTSECAEIVTPRIDSPNAFWRTVPYPTRPGNPRRPRQALLRGHGLGARRHVLDGGRRRVDVRRQARARGDRLGFWMDRTEVTNRQFARFVKETAYVTIAERKPDPKDFPDAPRRSSSRARSSSRRRPAGCLSTTRSSGGATCPARAGGIPKGPAARSTGKTTIRSFTFAGTTPSLTPTGPASGCRPRRSGRSPRAAGRLAAAMCGATTCSPGGKWQANIWEGHFPDQNSGDDGFARTAPVATFPAQRLRALRHRRQRLGMVLPTGIDRVMRRASVSTRPARARAMTPPSPACQEARSARGVVPVQRPILHTISTRRAGQGGRRQRGLAPGVSVRAIGENRAVRRRCGRGGERVAVHCTFHQP